MSLYADYIKEREGKCAIESELGFITYQIAGTDCYLLDIYVRPEYRTSGEWRRLTYEAYDVAKSAGCKRLFGSVVPTAVNSTKSLKAMLYLDFKLFQANENFILLMKEVS